MSEEQKKFPFGKDVDSDVPLTEGLPEYIETFNCGHQNNLLLEKNTKGLCPKGCNATK